MQKKSKSVEAEIKLLADQSKGEEKFRIIEKVYKRHNYHPIQSIGLSASLWFSMPFLLSALLLFSGDTLLTNHSFFFIGDLSHPDNSFMGINVLPVAMAVLTLLDALIRFSNDKKSLTRFLIISGVLLILVYPLSAGIILYWIGLNIFNFFDSVLLGKFRNR
jgi:membrane protein insertase Oxa1/YidC/SpoIIIJ